MKIHLAVFCNSLAKQRLQQELQLGLVSFCSYALRLYVTFIKPNTALLVSLSSEFSNLLVSVPGFLAGMVGTLTIFLILRPLEEKRILPNVWRCLRTLT